MNRRDLQALCLERLADAKALLATGRYAGAYYLAGYALECALKACIARQTREHDFPEKERALKAWTHDLARLFACADFMDEFRQACLANPALGAAWDIVRNWSEEARYAVHVPRAPVVLLLRAIEDPSTGVLPWIQSRW